MRNNFGRFLNKKPLSCLISYEINIHSRECALKLTFKSPKIESQNSEKSAFNSDNELFLNVVFHNFCTMNTPDKNCLNENSCRNRKEGVMLWPRRGREPQHVSLECGLISVRN